MSLLLDKFHRFGDSVHQFYSKVSLAFSVKIALLGSVSWLFASGIAVFVDPLLEPTRSKLFGISSNYPLGLGIFAVGIPIFILLQRVNKKGTDASRKSVKTFLAYALVGIASLPNFYPFPHIGVLMPLLAYSTLLGLTTFVHEYQIRSPRVVASNASVQAKIERVKLEFELWFRTLVLLATAATVAASASIFTFFASAQNFLGGDFRAALWLSYGLTIQTVYALVLVFGIVWLMFAKLTQIAEVLETMNDEKAAQSSSVDSRDLP